MKIKAIEPTPNPNSMKITLDECLPQGIHKTFSQTDIANAPLFIQDILKISGVKSVFHVMDFVAVERNPKQGWEPILSQIKEIFDGTLPSQSDSYETDAYGSAKVFVQMIKGIPMQVKVLTERADARFPLPDRFTIIAKQAASASADFLKERQWVPKGIRYGRGEQGAIPAMTEALKDPSKIVRWRAARFLYEVGDKSVLYALWEEAHERFNRSGRKVRTTDCYYF